MMSVHGLERAINLVPVLSSAKREGIYRQVAVLWAVTAAKSHALLS
jgi:hypothetical protein